MTDRAAGINDTTKAQLIEHVADPDLDPADVFKTAKDSRARAAGQSLSTWVENFATRETAKQITEREGVGFTKTWRTGENPRASHARMDGETVPVGEPFSNGMDFPGQSNDPDESAGCNCTIVIAETAPQEES